MQATLHPVGSLPVVASGAMHTHRSIRMVPCTCNTTSHQLRRVLRAESGMVSSAQTWRSGRMVCCASGAADRDLWAYEGSAVQEMNLDTLKFLHRTSYGHRNRRTAMVVVYDPQDPACQAAEFEVERLATGLQHAPHVMVAKLNVRAHHTLPGSPPLQLAPGSPTPTALFVEGILQVESLPAVLLYPEGAPGMVRYKGASQLTAESLLRALNQCQRTVLPNRPPLQLQGPAQASSSAATASVAAAGNQLESPGTTLPANNTSQASIEPNSSSSSSSSSRPAGSAAVASQAATAAASKAPTWSMRHSYWTPGKIWFWLGIFAIGFGTIVWEKWLGPQLELRAFLKRQEARAAGDAEAFDEDTNLDDLFRLRMAMQAAAAEQQQQAAALGALPQTSSASRGGSRERDMNINITGNPSV